MFPLVEVDGEEQAELPYDETAHSGRNHVVAQSGRVVEGAVPPAHRVRRVGTGHGKTAPLGARAVEDLSVHQGSRDHAWKKQNTH